jgi:RNA polymerase sigma-70 factor (ECF subfamily)
MSTTAGVTPGVLGSTTGSATRAAAEPLAHADDFSLLYEHHLPVVYRFVAARVATREEAEDLTSEVFRQAWTNRQAFRGRGSFRAWLFTIVRRTLADHYRARRRGTPRVPTHLGAAADVDLDIKDDTPSPEDQVVQDERELLVRTLLARLTPEQQEVLSLRFAAELTYAEIAVVIGKREDAVKKIAYRALDSLRGPTADYVRGLMEL